LLILGFNFLKGKSLTTKNIRYYAIFDNIQGLTTSNPVVINGKQVGAISNTNGGIDMRKIIVTINMTQEVNIPANSFAVITPSLLGTTALEIKLGNAANLYKTGDTLSTKASAGYFDEAFQRVDPVLFQVKNAVRSLDSVLLAISDVLDEKTKHNIKATIENLNNTTASLTVSAASLNTLLNTQTGALAKTLENVSSFTGALKDNNEKISQTMSHVEEATGKLAKLDLETTLSNLNGTITDLKSTIGKVNSDKGSIGLLLNDTKLYNNLTATSNKLNLLLDDVRMHPKRYINISVFGKKDKDGPLMTPLPDTINAPYIKK
jgi:phospholipid/cholesterol/gamma-HCH transport system substrate-binding protein